MPRSQPDKHNSDYATEFRRRFPLLETYVQTRYVPLLDVPVRDDLEIHILIDPTLPFSSRDVETGFPCFSPVRSS